MKGTNIRNKVLIITTNLQLSNDNLKDPDLNVKQLKCIYFFIDNWLVTFDGPIMNLPQIASFGVWAANSLPYEIMMALEPCAKAL